MRRLLDQFNTDPSWKLNLQAFENEALNLHEGRSIKSMTLGSTKVSGKLIDANLQDQAARSRIAAISFRCQATYNNMSRALELVQDYLLLKYRDDIKGFRSKEDKMRVINRVFKDLVTYMGEVANLIDNLATITEDIDKAGFTLQRINTTLQLSDQKFKPERNL